MIISSQVAQSIVDEMSRVTDFNINFMNEEGKIIASVDDSRIGDFHEGARNVIASKAKVIISEDTKLEGAKNGINLPVFLHNQVVGVIGVTGEPSSVGHIAEIIQKMTEVLVKEAYLEEQIELESRAKQSYIEEWITGDWEDDKLFASRGWIMGINIHLPRVAVILDLTGFNDWIYQKLKSHHANVKGELEVQRARRDILSVIQDHFPEKSEHVIVPSGSTKYTLLLATDEELPLHKRKEKINYRLNKIQSAIKNNHHFNSIAGIGRMYTSPREMKKSAEEAALALRRADFMEKRLFYYDQLGLESFIYHLDKEIRNDFVERILQPELFPKKQQYLETLDVFFRENGSITKASQELYIHKNTLQYRLNKIHEILGYDPRKLSDAVLLKVALAFLQANTD